MKRMGVIMFSLLLFLYPGYRVRAEEVEITAKSAVVMEAKTGRILYEKQADTPMPPASVTKVMTLLLIFEAMEQGVFDLKDPVTVSEHAASMGGSQVFLEAGETQTVEVMIKSIAIASGNDASVAMAEKVSGSEAVFVKKMNQKAQELGMKHTKFLNCCGLDAKGHETTARDIAIMSRELILTYPQVLTYSSIWMDEFTHKTRKGESVFGLSNTNKLLKQYEGCNGLKTGSTSQAKFCLSATAVRKDITMIAAIMASDTSKDRVRDAAVLLDHGFANCVPYTVPAFKEKLKNIRVKGGEEPSVAIKEGELFSTILTNGESKDSITYNIQRKKQLTAPVKKGAAAGWITFYYKGDYIGKIPLVTTKAVRKMTYRNMVKQVFLEFIL